MGEGNDATVLSREAPPVFASTVPADGGGMRLDRWLTAAHGGHSRSRLKALIEGGALTLNGAPETDPSRRLRGGESVRLAEPPPVDPVPLPREIPLTVVFEDDAVIVLDKPAGLVVHPAPGAPDHTLVNALLAHCGDSLSGIGGVRRPGIVHRLDKDTSGLMVVAKTDAAHKALALQFGDRTLHRTYHALVWGVPSPARGEIDAPMGRHPTQRTKMAVVTSGGKAALTRYQTLRAYGSTALALVECRLATGRTHQIRVHMDHIGHPLVGDQTYGRRNPSGRGGPVSARRPPPLPPEIMTRLIGLPRQALHAVALGFMHPTRGEPMHFESRIPLDIAEILATLETLQNFHSNS
ncbi:RluA family pseudouridine synthase [Roseospira marina]|uniref:Pseudouridine synthase n=1 Tax=Roseospira marina TaxID=140057 RepID=A0A5M6IBD9_9PROT|nr:RluA family pseudouridine synthase [Roseospira marina]KAA5605277.1 RluA family pseudouridine synthase [Roseospira marina]MBB4314738.1 23S rRNA pseudouridine1911/1915/1917 synthase [Roseospira marina]MBB5087727.1 23S rRNA pseudouridine1911/1915/1917 synthase [Roseospira marina]